MLATASLAVADCGACESVAAALALALRPNPQEPVVLGSTPEMGYVADVSGPVSRILFGTARLAQTEDPMGLLDAVWASGVNSFDLARCYGGGESEVILGKWMESRGIERSQVRLFAKGGCGDQSTYWAATLQDDVLERELLESLSALHVTAVDCYMLHRDDERMDVGTIVRSMVRFLARGQALSYGFSNWRFERVVAAFAYARANGLPVPVAVSPQFSLAKPARPVWPGTTVLADVREAEWYTSHGIAVLCWEVLGKGFMAAASRWAEFEATAPPAAEVLELEAAQGGGADLGTGDEFREFCIRGAYATRENFQRRRRALEIAAAHGVPLPQVAVSYVLAQSPLFFALVGPRSTEHYFESLPQFRITKEEADALEAEINGCAAAALAAKRCRA